MKRALGYVSSGLAFAILVGVLLGYGGAFLFELDLLAHFRLHLLLLIPPVAVLAFAGQQWTALLRLGTAALFALAGLAPAWAPSHVGSENGTQLVVLTANLSYDNPRPDLVRAALLAEDADILVTNETTKAMQSGVTSLARHYPFRLMLSTSRTVLRTVVWSKYPMREGRLLLEADVEPTGAMAIVTLPDGFEVLVLGLHMGQNAGGKQQTHIEALGSLLEDRPHPRIVLGDFNATPWSWALQRVESLTRTARVPGYFVTWRGDYPTPLGNVPAILGQAIDHILVSPSIGIQEVSVVDVPGSDHMGIRAVLRIP